MLSGTPIVDPVLIDDPVMFVDPACVALLNRDSLTPESVVCETTRVWRAEPKSPVQVFFDGARITMDRDFVYRDDPIITDIHPLATIRE